MIPLQDRVKKKRTYSRKGSADFWRVVAYCAEPSLTMENVKTGERVTFGVNGPLAAQFKPSGQTPLPNEFDGLLMETPKTVAYRYKTNHATLSQRLRRYVSRGGEFPAYRGPSRRIILMHVTTELDQLFRRLNGTIK